MAANFQKKTINVNNINIKIEGIDNQGKQNMYLKRPLINPANTAFSLSKNPSNKSLKEISQHGQPEHAMKDTMSF